ncbi:hypothetical protein PR048_031889 [Dryococelus australis]|uniref:Uncharacterized protein n=1 Tax=Dryococelus australis TaxID=614101 RepID=A0ABQ9G6J6_9NEOP|nr:hypothetical protein PR048_031889 [Dryococelus australis]
MRLQLRVSATTDGQPSLLLASIFVKRYYFLRGSHLILHIQTVQLHLRKPFISCKLSMFDEASKHVVHNSVHIDIPTTADIFQRGRQHFSGEIDAKGLSSHVNKRIPQFYGHIVRRNNDNLEKTILEGTIEGKRSRGRAPIRWLDKASRKPVMMAARWRSPADCCARAAVCSCDPTTGVISRSLLGGRICVDWLDQSASWLARTSTITLNLPHNYLHTHAHVQDTLLLLPASLFTFLAEKCRSYKGHTSTRYKSAFAAMRRALQCSRSATCTYGTFSDAPTILFMNSPKQISVQAPGMLFVMHKSTPQPRKLLPVDINHPLSCSPDSVVCTAILFFRSELQDFATMDTLQEFRCCKDCQFLSTNSRPAITPPPHPPVYRHKTGFPSVEVGGSCDLQERDLQSVRDIWPPLPVILKIKYTAASSLNDMDMCIMERGNEEIQSTGHLLKDSSCRAWRPSLIMGDRRRHEPGDELICGTRSRQPEDDIVANYGETLQDVCSTTK